MARAASIAAGDATQNSRIRNERHRGVDCNLRHAPLGQPAGQPLLRHGGDGRLQLRLQPRGHARQRDRRSDERRRRRVVSARRSAATRGGAGGGLRDGVDDHVPAIDRTGGGGADGRRYVLRSEMVERRDDADAAVGAFRRPSDRRHPVVVLLRLAAAERCALARVAEPGGSDCDHFERRPRRRQLGVCLGRCRVRAANAGRSVDGAPTGWRPAGGVPAADGEAARRVSRDGRRRQRGTACDRRVRGSAPAADRDCAGRRDLHRWRAARRAIGLHGSARVRSALATAS